jgi:PHD/YefM family antitoxin component YafN of YafNO toxin-antitoxin module
VKTIQASIARRRWSYVLGHVHHTGEYVLIVRNRRPLVALVHPDDVELLQRFSDEADIEEAREALRQAADSKEELPLSWAELRRLARLDR